MLWRWLASYSLHTMPQFVLHQPDRRGVITRREWLRVGGFWLTSLAAAAASRPRAAQANSRRPPGFGRAKSVILIFASGGQSQLETWDPKPQAPAEVRGEFSAIPTAVPGLLFGEHMPRLAKVADRFSVLRTLSHEDLDHGSAAYLALTGRYHKRRSSNPAPSHDDFPTYGAVLNRTQPHGRFVYNAVHINGPALVPENVAPGQNGGLLGREYEPLLLGDVSRQAVAIPGLLQQDDLPPVRMSARHSLKATLDRYLGALARNRRALDMSHMYRQAYEILAAPHCRQAFDLGAEPRWLRERYGRHRSGQACLLARRLAEAGVPLITVIFNHSNRGQDLAPDSTDLYGWDTHNDIFHALKVHLLPRFDQSFSALLEDLDARGLMDQTLVVCMGEFGRAPKVALEPKFKGSAPGRKHWATVYSIVMAGAGVTRGAALGSSDRFAAEPVTQRYGPWDVAATMYSALGIDPQGHFVDSLKRPFALTVGRPIEDLYRG